MYHQPGRLNFVFLEVVTPLLVTLSSVYPATGVLRFIYFILQSKEYNFNNRLSLRILRKEKTTCILCLTTKINYTIKQKPHKTTGIYLPVVILFDLQNRSL